MRLQRLSSQGSAALCALACLLSGIPAGTVAHAGDGCIEQGVARLTAGTSPAASAGPRPLTVRPLDYQTIKAHRKKDTPIYYIKDSLERVYVIDEPLLRPDDGVMIVQTRGAKTGELRLAEFGELKIQKKGAAKFKPQVKFEPDPLPPGAGVAKDGDALTKAQYLNCLSILADQSRAGNIVMSYLKANIPVQIAVELAFIDPTASEENFRRFAADVLGGIVTGAAGTWVGTKVVQRGSGFVPYAAAALPLGIGLTWMQNQINDSLDVETQENPEWLSDYNYGHRFAMFVPSYILSRWFAEGLPGRLYDRCRKGQSLTFGGMSPGALRWAERIGQAVIYFGPRELYFKPEEK